METGQILIGLSNVRSELALLRMRIDSVDRTLDFQRRLDDLRKPDGFLKEAEKAEPLIQKNFEEWRDYLHKYSLVMMSIAAFFTTLIGSNLLRITLNWTAVYWAFGFIGASVFLALLSIFITIFVERKIIDARIWFELPGKERDKRINPIDGKKMDYRESIQQCKAKLEVETNPEEIQLLKKQIKVETKGLRLMYFVAAPVGWYEQVRLWVTAAMLCLSFIGIVIMMTQFLRKSDANLQQVQHEEIKSPFMQELQ